MDIHGDFQQFVSSNKAKIAVDETFRIFLGNAVAPELVEGSKSNEICIQIYSTVYVLEKRLISFTCVKCHESLGSIASDLQAVKNNYIFNI